MTNNRPSEGGRFGKAPIILERTAPGRVKSSYEISGPLLPGQDSGGDMLMCVHGGEHWRIVPGSGMVRGFCLRCNGPTCGKEKCETRCIPFEQAIEQIEREGRSINTRGAVLL